MKINFLKTKKNFKKGGFHTNPNISWAFLLFVTFILINASFVFGYYLFTQTDKEYIVSAEDTVTGTTRIVTKERMNKVLEFFSEREKKSVKILNSPAPVVDPSL